MDVGSRDEKNNSVRCVCMELPKPVLSLVAPPLSLMDDMACHPDEVVAFLFAVAVATGASSAQANEKCHDRPD